MCHKRHVKVSLGIALGALFPVLLCSCGHGTGSAVARAPHFTGVRRYLPAEGARKVDIPGRRQQVLAARHDRETTWTHIAPGFVNVPSHVELDGDTITMLIDIGGLMQSTNGGRTWKALTYHLEGGVTGRTFFDFDISPRDGDRIVIGGNLIYATDDGGRTWKEIRRGLPESRYGRRRNGFGQVAFTADGTRLFTATGTKPFMPVGWEKLLSSQYERKNVYVSGGDVENFRAIPLEEPFAPVARIQPHPNDPDVVYVSFKDGSFYRTRNATAVIPDFEKQNVPAGYFVQDMAISPEAPSRMLVTLTPKDRKTGNAAVAECRDCLAGAMSFKELPLHDEDGRKIVDREFLSIGFNPNQPRQIVVGSAYNDHILISDNGLRSVRKFSLPERFYCDGLMGNFYGNIERVFFGDSPHAVVVSRIGSWISSDNFASLEDLTMTCRDGEFGNKGMGSPANVNALAFTKNHLYFSAQDHRAWRASNDDHNAWKKITADRDNEGIPTQDAPWGQLTWFWGVERIFASDDDKIVYINADAYEKDYKGSKFWQNKKFFVSRNQGETWTDMTTHLGRGDVYPGNSLFLEVLFDERSSERQWFLFSDALFFSADGGATFTECTSPLFAPFTREERNAFSDAAFDEKHGILYLAATVADSDLDRKLEHALFRSADMGKTWEPFDIGQNAVKSIGVTASGTLVVGTMKAADQPARLIVIPCGKAYHPGMVKKTMGDTEYEISANQLSFWPVVTDGEDILAYANINWVHSDRFFAQGPLLSTDGGDSFEWMNHDLPCSNIWSAEMKDGTIVLGTIFGILETRYK